MKKILVFALFLLLVCYSVVSAQTCDCESLQEQIDELNNKIKQSQSLFSKEIEPTDYREIIFLDKDYSIQYNEKRKPISIANVSVPTVTGESKDFLVFQIPLYLKNSSPFDLKVSEKIFIRAYQNKNYLDRCVDKQTAHYEIVNNYNAKIVLFAFFLNNDIDDVTLEICEILPNEQLNQVATWVISLSDAVRE